MINTRIHNRYRIDCKIGQGGMGTIYKGYDTALKRDVAIKMLTETKLGTEGRSRLLHEAQAIAQLNHPNIITVYDVGEHEKSPYIVMAYVEGVNLYDQPPTDIEEIVVVMQQVCAALAHAHEHGIIHRDLKPENVILTADGTVKLMDFGLARSISSRMTTEGTIFGTVFFLAPEQAQGKPIDTRSDLYSLGVMLYELTTGELPFTADDPLAVISQHIHASVVPPRAKNEQIPPALEALILKLMAKSPTDRPASALEVLEQLSAPEMLDITALPKQELSVLDRIVRGRLVGRECELNQVRQMWQQAMIGKGQLLMISGEAGIGKTRLMREIITQVEVSGGQAFIGESQAEGNAPYAAFAQIILRALRVHQKDELDLTNLVIAELISITPELQVDFPDIPQNPALDPESEQRRLFECIYRFFGALCSEKPTLLVLEDILWADSGTLSLFSFLAQRCLDHPVMLLSTYREVELDEALPFYQTLLDLKRNNLGKRLKLERLGEEKTRDLLTVIFNTNQITQEFLDGIYKETEGNPFFIEEVCKTLIEKGQVYFDGERWRRKPDMSDMEIPQSIKIAVQSRISKLNESTQDVLRNAAVIGREFSFILLQKVTQFEEDKLINCLEDAIKSKLIEELKKEGEERFSFIHALIQTTLRDSLSGMRKTRLHRRVAQVMEEDLPDAYQRLAYHWGKGGNEHKALDYTIKAAEKAKHSFANGDAIRLYGEALDFLSKNDVKRFNLLKARAEIYNMIGDRIAQRAEIEAMLAVSVKQADQVMQVDSLHALAELNLQTDVKKALEPAESAYNISQKIDDLPRLAKSAILIGRYYFRYYEFHQSIRYYEEAVQIARKAGLKYELLDYLRYLAAAQNNLGQIEAKIATALEAVDLSNVLNDPRSIVLGKRLLAMAYHAEGRYEEGLSLCQTALKMAREIGDLEQEFDALNVLAWNLDGLGRGEEEEKIYLMMIQDFDIYDFHRVIVALNNLVNLHVTLGEYEENHALVSSLMEKARHSGNENIQFFLAVHYEGACSRLGKFQEGLNELENVWPTVDKSMNKISKSFLLSSLGVSSGLAGDFNAAAHYSEQSQIISEELEDSKNKSDVWVNCAFTSLIDGQTEVLKEGLDQITCSLGILYRLGPVDNWFAYCVKAGIHLALLSEDIIHANKALVAIEEALRIFNGYPEGWGTIEYLFYTASQVYRANVFLKEADDYLRKAYERVMLIAGKIKDDDLRKSFLENVPENRGILKEAEAKGWVTK